MAESGVGDLERLLEKAKGARSKFEPGWYLNVAFYQGNQWTFYNRGRLQEPRLDPWRVTFTDNRIIGIIRTEVAKLTKQRPIFVATPTTGSESDVNAAQLAERMLDYTWTFHDLQRKQRSALNWARICGAGFWKIYWDPSLGDKTDVLLGPDGQIITAADGSPAPTEVANMMPAEVQAALTQKQIPMGDICVDVRSPLQMFVDPLAGDEGLSSAEWIIEEIVKSKDYVRRKYDVDLPEDADAIAGIAESRMGPLVGGSVGAANYRGVRLREMWARPSSKYPNGRYVVWAAGKILRESDAPYDELPYVMFSGIPVPGRFWPTSIVEQLRPPQTEMNKTRSQIRENAARIGNPALLRSRVANVNYTGVPGEIIDFDDTLPNSRPGYLEAPEMPAYVLQEIDRMEVSLREISGQHEVTGATVPSGVTAASAINLLQEADDTRIGPDIQDMEQSLGEAGRKILKLIAHFYNDSRTVRIAGDDGDWDIFDFRGSMLRDTTHVAVQAGSAFPSSKAAKQASMQSLLQLFIQNQVPLSQRQISRFLKDMEVGGFERFIDQLSQDEIQVNSENRRMSLGELLPINTYDDDEGHIEGHREFQKSARYWNMLPQVKEIFEKHVAAHVMRQQQIQAQQAQAQLAQQIQIEQAKHPEPPSPSSSNVK